MFEIENDIEMPEDNPIDDLKQRFVNPVVDGMKKCGNCGEIKNVKEFRFRKDRNNYNSRCKQCDYVYGKKYFQTEVGKKCNREKTKRYLEKNPDYVKNWAKTKSGKESQKRYNAKRTSTVKGKISNAISANIYASLKGNKHGWHWETLVGFTLQDLIDHLEVQFEPWMNFNNYGRSKNGERTWSLDHIIPVDNFDINSYDDEDFKRCWDLDNLRPLCFIENASKRNKIA